MIATLSPTMPRPRKEESEPLRVTSRVARLIRVAAAAAGESVPDFISHRIEKLLRKEFPEVVRMVELREKKAEKSDD